MGAQSSDAIPKLIHDFLCCLFAGAHAIGNADSVVGTAGESEAREFCELRFDSLNARLMA